MSILGRKRRETARTYASHGKAFIFAPLGHSAAGLELAKITEALTQFLRNRALN